jgi:hypothetical protein
MNDPTLNPLPLPVRIWWPWEEPVERIGFESRVTLVQPAQGILHISSSGPYRAWLDGSPLPVPELPYPSWRVMHAIPANLSEGEHCLSIEAEPGQHSQPFLLACLDWEFNGTAARLASGAAWRMAANPPASWVSHPEVLDWRAAWAFDGVWSEPWGMPCNAPDDFCRLSAGWQVMERDHLTQAAQIYPGQASLGAAASLQADGSIEMRPARPVPPYPPRLENTRPRLEWYRTREAHSMTNNTWLDLFEVRAPHIVFDAGSETFARLAVRVHSGGPAILALTTGESLNEVHRYHRRVTDIFSLQDGESFITAPTGFRYAKVIVLSSGREAVHLEPVEIQHIHYPVDAAGSFSCSDPELEAIWNLSALTAHLCMQTEIWDGIKRDQLPWMGDLYTEAVAIYHAFGDFRLARRSLAILAEIGPAPDRPLADRRYPGLHSVWKAPGGTPYGPQSGDINGIPAYTLWWLIGLSDYVRYSGDRSLVEELGEELEATLTHVAGWVDEDGVWRLKGGWDFIDWAPVAAGERAVYCHLLACRALRLGAQLLQAAGRQGKGYEQLADKMAEAARRNWWQDGRGSFGASHHVNAAAISSGILSPNEAAALFEQTLAPDPPLSMTYWHRFLDLNAAAEVGQVQWGLDAIRKYWGLALKTGMTTLWEAFDPAWMGDDPHAVSMVGAEYARYGGYETSLCHGWSAGPAAWLHTAMLGIQPNAFGYTKVNFTPHLGDLAWANGAIPTPHGPIFVSLWREPDGAQLAEIRSPVEIELTSTMVEMNEPQPLTINAHAYRMWKVALNP